MVVESREGAASEFGIRFQTNLHQLASLGYEEKAMPPIAITLLATVVLIFQGVVQKTQTRKSDPEFYIKVEVQGPLAPGSDPTKRNIACIRYGEGFARQTIL